jgi:hypothetical protein
MVVTPPNRRETDRRRRAGLLILCLAGPLSGAADGPSTAARFDPVYDLLTAHCGACHVRGGADGPWSLDTPPRADRFPECLPENGEAALRCATFHELVDAPAPGIPPWIRPQEAAASEPYAQACDPVVSFHIGHSLPAKLPDRDCTLFLEWIEAGAPR